MVIRCSLVTKKRDVNSKDIPKFYDEIRKHKISVGVFGSVDAQGVNNAKKALWNEFGYDYISTHDYRFRKKMSDGHFENIFIPKGHRFKVPARPFIRLYMYPEILRNISEFFVQNIDYCFMSGLKTSRTLAKNLLLETAIFAEEQMKKTANENEKYDPNAELTIAIKGFNQPLYKTGNMIDSIRGRVGKR